MQEVIELSFRYQACINGAFYFLLLLEMVPKDLEKELKNIYNALCELLRHFWSCFPPTTKALEEKADNMHAALRRFEMAKVKLFEVLMGSILLCCKINRHLPTYF